MDRETCFREPLASLQSGQGRLRESEWLINVLVMLDKSYYVIFSLSTSHQLPPLMVVSFAGCYLVKKCAEVAFRKHHRAMLAGDMVQEVGPVFHSELEPNAR